MLKMKIIFKIAIILAIMSLISGAEIKTKRKKICHHNYALLCFDFLRQFTAIINGTGAVETDKEFRHFCNYTIINIPACYRNWVKKCGNPVHEELLDALFLKPYVSSMTDFCDPNGKIKKRFLKYANCLNVKVKLSQEYRETCVKDIQAGFEYAQSLEHGSGLESMCCTYNRWENCITSFMNRECGEESMPIIVDLIRALSAHIVAQLCPQTRFNPKTEECARVLPPRGSPAKGAKSKSYLSFLFSYYCPNVGYGIKD